LIWVTILITIPASTCSAMTAREINVICFPIFLINGSCCKKRITPIINATAKRAATVVAIFLIFFFAVSETVLSGTINCISLI